MKFVFVVFIFLVNLNASDPYKNITHYTLDNGLKVYLYPDNKAKNTAINVDVKVGMKAEEKEDAGISHLVEHIVFRDARVKDRDYLDLFKDEGASYVNGYTGYYKTKYVATIEADKSYWIVEQFAQMLLDKNVTHKDLESERGALQVEIGEATWVDKYLPDGENIIYGLKNIIPDSEDFYKDEFGVDLKEREPRYQSSSTYRLNNQDFTFEDVLKHYNEYYYPSNMSLIVVGNFELEKMIDTVEIYFGKFTKKKGKSVLNKYKNLATLNNKPYNKYDIGTDGSSAAIGAKIISDDPKKEIILDSYVNDLARRLNVIFRNKNGESYGAYGSYYQYYGAAVASVSFSAEHSALDKNIQYAKNQISTDISGNLTDKQINEALEISKKQYNNFEHNSESLMEMVFSYQKFYEMHDETKTPLELLSSVTLEQFRTTIKEAFTSKNLYQNINRDYHFFPHDFTIYVFLLVFLFLYIIYKFFSVKIADRDIRMQRRLTGRFVSFLLIFLSLVIATILAEWLFYFTVKLFPISPLWENGYDTPTSYLIHLVDLLISLFIIYIVVKKLFGWFYIKLFATNHTIILSGARNKFIQMADIRNIEVENWSFSKLGKPHGISLMFWKPILKITSHKHETIYLRSTNASELKTDLEYIIFEKDRRDRLLG